VKNKFFFIFRIAVTLGLFYALFKFVPYQKIIAVYKDSRKIYLFLGAGVFLCCYLLAMLRWRFLLSALGIKITFKEGFCSFFSGLFFNLFFPSFVAGDFFRGFTISYRHGYAKKVASSVLMDRYSGGTALTLVGCIAFIAGRNILREKSVIFALSFLCAAVLISSLIIFSKRVFLFFMKVFKKAPLVEDKLIAFHDQLYFFKKNPRLFFKSFLFSFPIQILTPFGFFVASRAFNVDLSFVIFLILIPIIMAIALIPITIAGAGTREAAAVYFFSLVGIDKSIGLGISLFNLIFIIGISIFGGILYVTVYHRWIQSRSQNR